MKNKNLLLFKLSILVILFVLVGFLREHIFVQINYRLGYLRTLDPSYDPYMTLPFIRDLSFSTLYYGKFVLTLLFSLIYMLLGYTLINMLFHNSVFNKYTIALFLLVIFISFILYLTGYLYNDIYSSYEIARYLAGLVQSPIIPMVLVLVFKFGKTEVES